MILNKPPFREHLWIQGYSGSVSAKISIICFVKCSSFPSFFPQSFSLLSRSFFCFTFENKGGGAGAPPLHATLPRNERNDFFMTRPAARPPTAGRFVAYGILIWLTKFLRLVKPLLNDTSKRKYNILFEKKKPDHSSYLFLEKSFLAEKDTFI